jgi:hypothetical protein
MERLIVWWTRVSEAVRAALETPEAPQRQETRERPSPSGYPPPPRSGDSDSDCPFPKPPANGGKKP